MIRTEEEAAKVICHVTLAAGRIILNCQGKKCMAWRWSVRLDGETVYEDKRIEGQPGMFEHAPMGYCGLAGEPKS